MLEQLRRNIIQKLWDIYRTSTPDMRLIEAGLDSKGLKNHTLDHFAVIDLPGSFSGIPHLCQLFSSLGYIEHGKDYLADKQNDFLWMTESNCAHRQAKEVLPQVVVADFRLDKMPLSVRTIISKYASQTKPLPLENIQTLLQQVANNDSVAFHQCTTLVTNYLAGRDWTLPSTREFYTVREFNELLAWVLIFGRRPNHFTLSIHLLDHFDNLNHFHHFITDELKLELNQEGGVIKGNKTAGIEQGSTIGLSQSVKLSDGTIEIPTGFVEFVWRYPGNTAIHQPTLWSDYYTGFIAQHANRVIESLFTLNTAG